MSALARALLADLGTDDLADLAAALAPYLPAAAPAAPAAWLTAREAAEYLALSYSTLKKKMAAGEVPCEREGGRCYFRRADLDRWRAGAGKYAYPGAAKRRMVVVDQPPKRPRSVAAPGARHKRS